MRNALLVAIALFCIPYPTNSVFPSDRTETGQLSVFVSSCAENAMKPIAAMENEIGPNRPFKRTKPFLRLKVDWPQERRQDDLQKKLDSSDSFKKREYVRKLMDMEARRPGRVPVGETIWQGDEMLDLCVLDWPNIPRTFPVYYWLDGPVIKGYNGVAGSEYTVSLSPGEYRCTLYLAFRDPAYDISALTPLSLGASMEVRDEISATRSRMYLFGEPMEVTIEPERRLSLNAPFSKLTEWWDRYLMRNLTRGTDYE